MSSESESESESESDSEPEADVCDCFDDSGTTLELTCELAPSCGTVDFGQDGEDWEPVPEPDPQVVAANFAAMACFLDAVAAGEQVSIDWRHSTWHGVNDYQTDIIVLEDSSALRWGRTQEDIGYFYTPVEHHTGVASALSACSGMEDDRAQWMCIDAAVAGAPVAATCTEEVWGEDP